MSDQPISDLISRMLQDMIVRQFSEKTQHDYIRHVEVFAKFLGRSPATATGDDLRRFQFQQAQDGAQPPKMNTQASALRFLFAITLGRADLAHQLARTHYPKKLPRILSPDDVALLLEAAPGPGLKYKAALMLLGPLHRGRAALWPSAPQLPLRSRIYRARRPQSLLRRGVAFALWCAGGASAPGTKGKVARAPARDVRLESSATKRISALEWLHRPEDARIERIGAVQPGP